MQRAQSKPGEIESVFGIAHLSRSPLVRLKSFLSISSLGSHFPALHGLRLLAVIAVIMSHNDIDLSNAEVVLHRRFTWMSMDFFFIMSGFLIGNILLHDSGHRGWAYFRKFYVRRSFRILPAYYVTLFLLVLRSVRGNGLEAIHRSLLREVVFLTNYPSIAGYFMNWSWSLSLEEHCYLISPFVILGLFRVARSFRLPLLLSFFFLPLFFRLYSARHTSDFFVGVFTPTHLRFDPFVMGLLVAYARKTWPEKLEKLASRRFVTWGALFLGLVLMGIMFVTFSLPVPHVYMPLSTSFYLGAFYTGTLSSVAFALILFWAIYNQSSLARLLGCRPIQLLATLGYGIYLIHYPTIELCRRFFPHIGWTATISLAFVVSSIYSYFLHILLEKPLLALREKVS